VKLTDDHFTLLGLPQQQALDRAVLDARRRDLQGQVHPDRFAAEGATAQRIAMQWAVRVNEAYQCLKDPVARAAYLCALRGAPVDAERNTAMPAAFLMQQMAWREALEEAGDPQSVQQIDASVAVEERQMLASLCQMLDDEDQPLAAAAMVRALMFVARFRQDIDRRLDTLDLHR